MLRFLFLPTLVVSTLLLLAHRPAAAGCAKAGPFRFAPSSGATVPPNPVILIFLSASAPTLDALTVTNRNGDVVPVEKKVLKLTNPGKVIRLQISATQGAFTVSTQAGHRITSATFHIAGSKPAPKVEVTPRTEIAEATYSYSTGCPDSEGFVLHVTPRAVAYRVTVGRQTWVVPDLSRDLEISDGHGAIVTGHVGCLDFTIPGAKPFAISIVPLLADGSDGGAFFPGCQSTRTTRSTRHADGSTSVVLEAECSSHTRAEFSGQVKRSR